MRRVSVTWFIYIHVGRDNKNLRLQSDDGRFRNIRCVEISIHFEEEDGKVGSATNNN